MAGLDIHGGVVTSLGRLSLFSSPMPSRIPAPNPSLKGFEMAENETAGAARNVGGRVENAVGNLTGDTASQARG